MSIEVSAPIYKGFYDPKTIFRLLVEIMVSIEVSAPLQVFL